MKKSILHIVGGMNRAGLGVWLLHILKHIDRQQFQMDFLVFTSQPCALDDDCRDLGARIIPCPKHNLWKFKKILQGPPKYDVIHGHVHHLNGLAMRLAKKVGVPVRIAHSHNDTSIVDSKAGRWRQFYLTLMKSWINRYATVELAGSRDAATNLFGPSWAKDPRVAILNYSIDFEPFHASVNRREVREELGIPPDALVLAHVGRFRREKNQKFLVEIAAELVNVEPNMRLLLIGDGPLQTDLEKQVAESGLTGKVIFTGSRTDVPRLMLGAMDVFIFPSLSEGLGNSRLEAQAAGLPCIEATTVPEEGDVVKPLIQRLSLSQPVSDWVAAILAARQQSISGITRQEALKLMEQSPFDTSTSVRQLERIYTSA